MKYPMSIVPPEPPTTISVFIETGALTGFTIRGLDPAFANELLKRWNLFDQLVQVAANLGAKLDPNSSSGRAVNELILACRKDPV